MSKISFHSELSFWQHGKYKSKIHSPLDCVCGVCQLLSGMTGSVAAVAGGGQQMCMICDEDL